VHPDGCVDLLLKGADGEPNLALVGTMPRTHAVHIPAGTYFVGVRLRPDYTPGAFGSVASEPGDRTRPLQSSCTTLAAEWMHTITSADHPDTLTGSEELRPDERKNFVPRAAFGIATSVNSKGAASLMRSGTLPPDESQHLPQCVSRSRRDTEHAHPLRRSFLRESKSHRGTI
jgi:hypothetical protein